MSPHPPRTHSDPRAAGRWPHALYPSRYAYPPRHTAHGTRRTAHTQVPQSNKTAQARGGFRCGTCQWGPGDMRAPSARSGVPGEEERVRIAARLRRMRLTTRSDEGDEAQGETPASFPASSTSETRFKSCIGQLGQLGLSDSRTRCTTLGPSRAPVFRSTVLRGSDILRRASANRCTDQAESTRRRLAGAGAVEGSQARRCNDIRPSV